MRSRLHKTSYTRNVRHRIQATSCTGDIVYIHGHFYTQIATSYPMIMVRVRFRVSVRVRVRARVRVRVRYDVAVCVYKYQ